MSIYPVTGCARRLKPLFNPTMTTNQNRSFNALLSMFVFWRSFTELNSLHQDLKWTGKLCRVKINLYNVNIGLSLTQDNYYRLQHLQKKYDSWNTTKYMWIDNYAYYRPWPHLITTPDVHFTLLSIWDIHPRLLFCWSTVYDTGPALKQHWVNKGL